MAKDSFYFQHDYNARNDNKILELRSEYKGEGYGIFWMICEVMAENENGGLNTTLIGGLSLGFGVDKGWLIAFINFCIKIGLFFEEKGFLFSKRMLIHKHYRKSLSDGGRAGAELRWGGYSPPNAKERKGKERKGKEERETSPENDHLIFDIEDFLKKNNRDFELICMAAHKKEMEVWPVLTKYHLWNQENDKYPKKPIQLIAGFKKWLLTENKYANGTHSNTPPGNNKTAGRDQLIESLRNDIASG